MIEPRLFSAEEIELCVRPTPKRSERFAIVAYNAVGGWWTLAPAGLEKWYDSEGQARDAAARLSAIWTYIDIIRIPGGD